jgi:uncharacterized protein
MAEPVHRFDALSPPAGGAGIGLRSAHYAEFLATRPKLPFVEVHSENYFAGGRHLEVLLDVRRDTAVSLHGVGLSLGSADPLNAGHLAALKSLADRVEPALVSEHLCWSSIGGVYANDLLPLPYTREALAHVADRIDRVQRHLGRRILVENVSSYLEFTASEMSEWDFLAELARRAGCGVLLDINNIHVSAVNHGFDPLAYLRAMRADTVGEMHLAGHSVNRVQGEDGRETEILIDTHSRPVSPPVWALYEAALQCLGPKPTLVEWDADLPPLGDLLDEAGRAQHRLHRAAAGLRVAHAA